jgi:hypothetical protein
MESVFALLASLALLAVIFLVSRKRAYSTEGEIVKRFRQHEAVSKETAKTLKEIGLHLEMKCPPLMRDSQVELLHQLWQKGIIHEVTEGRGAEQARYYLDEKSIEQGK